MKKYFNGFAFLILLSNLSIMYMYSMESAGFDSRNQFAPSKKILRLRNRALVPENEAKFIVSGIKYVYKNSMIHYDSNLAWKYLVNKHIIKKQYNNCEHIQNNLRAFGLIDQCNQFDQYVRNIMECSVERVDDDWYEFKECLIYDSSVELSDVLCG